MPHDRVSSQLFVGREKELEDFKKLLVPTGKSQILSVHTSGKGGIGKTQLLLQMQGICEKRSDDVIYTKKLIDFYHTEARIKLGIMRLLAEDLGENNFPKFKNKAEKYDKAEDREQRKTLIQELEDAFAEDYKAFSENTGKPIILFFDTYEVVQESEFSIWLEADFFPQLKGNTRIVVAGRQPLSAISSAKQMEISPFEDSDTVKYWKKCFNVSTDSELENKIGSKEIIRKIHNLSKGHPVLLALFADWCQYEHNPLSSNELIAEIEAQIKEEPEKAEEQVFEIFLIERIASLKKPEDMAVTYLAFAHRRMTPKMFSFVTSKPLNESENVLLERLKPLSFIKYKEDQRTILLHDEMRDLVIRHWWEKQDAIRSLRKGIAEKLVEYYDGLLANPDISKMEAAILYAERLYYQLYADINAGFKSFIKRFDKYLPEYQIYFCDLISAEIVPDLFFKEFSSEKQLEIILRRIRWRNEQYRCSEALAFFEDTDEKSEYATIERDKQILAKFFSSKKKVVSKQDELLSAQLNQERGIAYLWLNDFEHAVHYFSQAERAFRRLREPYELAKSLNWLGFAYLRNSEFAKAEKVLNKSISEFLKVRGEIPDDFYVEISNAYNNLNPALRHQGRFYEAATHSEIAISIAEKKQNDREMARFLHSLGETYKFSNKIFEASKAFDNALDMLESTPDLLLEARALTAKALILYGHSDYIYILEYYRRGPKRDDALKIFHKVYSSTNFRDAKYNFDKAENILKEEPKTELAYLYFFLAEYQTVEDKWEEAIDLFKKSEVVAKEARNEYREIDAIVGQIIVHYFEGKKEDNKEVQACVNRVGQAKKIYHNLVGKMKIMLGNFAYERYLEDRDEEDLRKALDRYVCACNHMYSFGQVNRDRLYATFRILVKRIGDIPLEKMPSDDIIESFRNIWNYDEHGRAVCQEYSDRFDEIIDFALRRTQFDKDAYERKEYGGYCKGKIQRCINYGKEKLCFAPFYAEMFLRSQKTGSPCKLAEAHFYLANAHEVNGNVFEARRNITLASELVKGNELLRAEILTRSGRILYRQKEYAKTLEYYRQEDFRKSIEDYKKRNKQDINTAFSYFKKAGNILDSLEKKDSNEDEQKKLAEVRAHLEFRRAECLSLTGGNAEEVEKGFERAIIKAKEADSTWWESDATESLITHYYFSKQWEKKTPEIKALRNQFIKLQKKQYYPALNARLEITDGDVKYDRIFSHPKDESLIEDAFNHYILATRYKAEYSDKHFYEAVGTLLDRIAKLPKESVKLLHDKIYPRLHQKRPSGPIADKAYKLVEQALYIHSEVL